MYVCMYVVSTVGRPKAFLPTLLSLLWFWPWTSFQGSLCITTDYALMYVCSGDPKKPIGGLGLIGLLLGHGSHAKKGKWGA